MKLDGFKKIIKEAVKEAVREVLNEESVIQKDSLNENMTTLSFNSSNVNKNGRNNLAKRMVEEFGLPNQNQNKSNRGPFNPSENPFSSFLNDTANSMSTEDLMNHQKFS
jgi:thiaminase